VHIQSISPPLLWSNKAKMFQNWSQY